MMDRTQLEQMGIPVTGDRPDLFYIATLSNGSLSLKPAAEVTEAEAKLLRGYIDFICEDFYGLPFDRLVKRWSAKASPFAAVPGHNTITFLKLGDNDWRYRRWSWDMGPWMFPQPETGYGTPMDLAALLDHINGYGDRPNPKWEEWKRTRLATGRRETRA